MYIPDISEMEKGMHITYGNLVEEVQARQKKALERKQRLQADATLLIAELKKWLYLPDDSFIDEEGREFPFVDVFIKNQNGLFEKRPPQGLQTDKLHALNFYVGILLAGSDITTGWLYVPVEMFYKSGSLQVVSGDERSHVTVMHGTDQGRFFESSSLIKNSFIRAIKDPNLK